MNALKFSRQWLGPALAASLWIGFAAAPGPGLTAAEIDAIWGHPAVQGDQAPHPHAPQAQAPQDPAHALPSRPAVSARDSK
jgi:hypothetical protein